MDKIYNTIGKLRQTPLQLLIMTVVSIFLAETSIMFIMPLFHPASVYSESLVDAILLITLVFPMLFFFSYRPVLTSISGYKLAVEELKKAHDSLESQVEERTIMLKTTNEELQNEISEHRRTESKLIEAKEKAEESDRLKSIFLTNMRHELRTPMNGILGFSQILSDIDDLNDAKEIGENIMHTGKRLMETLDLILDLTRVESGDLPLELCHFDLNGEINGLIFRHRQIAAEKNLNISFYPKSEEFQCYSSPKIIMRVLNNILNNAIKFTSEGGIAITVDNEIIEGQKLVVIVVSDTGIGIEEKEFDNIFKEFRQVSEGIGRTHQGTGLGLTLSKKYIELLGGSISVKSTVNVGSAFKVLIPWVE